MNNYDLYLPTHIVFGKGRITELHDVLSTFGKNVLLTYGGGSIKKIGLYDKVLEQLRLADKKVFELKGIEPNPKITSVRDGVKICKEEKIDLILAVGGGSVIDCSKNIAAGAYYDGDPWDLVLDSSKVGKAVPIVSVLTLSATGSEYDNSAVISNAQTNEKLPIFGNNLNPAVSFLDPEYTFSVSAGQTAAGSVDCMSHTFESYLVREGNLLTDSLCEGMLKTIIKYAPIAISNPNDYEARANLMMACSFGCNGILAIGRDTSAWVCHAIEHELSAYYDITHGVGLAIITPAFMRYSLTEETVDRFAQYGENVFGLPKSNDRMQTAKKAIELTEEFFKSLGLPSKLSELGITDEHFDAMATHIEQHWFAPLTIALRPVDHDGVVEILKNSL